MKQLFDTTSSQRQKSGYTIIAVFFSGQQIVYFFRQIREEYHEIFRTGCIEAQLVQKTGGGRKS